MNRLSKIDYMYSSTYFYNLQKTLQQEFGARLELRFLPATTQATELIQSITVGPNNKISVAVNSKCKEFAVNSLQASKASKQLLLHMYDMCRSKEISVLLIKVKDTVAIAASEQIDFNYVINSISPRCWAWLPEEKKLLLTDLSTIPGLNKVVSHVCLEGHTEWRNYAELN